MITPAEISQFLPIGPDKENILEKRPYFLIPLLETDNAPTTESKEEKLEALLGRIVASVNAPISDIYVISHGWHRNLFGGVSAYDRLMSRLSGLMHRGRIILPQNYNPLFIALHWHSDPGRDGWIDEQGRRSKDSFLENARRCFNYSSATSVDFTNTFEDIFELFSRMSASDTNAEEVLASYPKSVSDRLANYSLANSLGDGESLGEKVATVWRCYHEATIKGSQEDQTVAPGARHTVWETLGGIVKILLPLLGFASLGSWALKQIPKPDVVAVFSALREAITSHHMAPILNPIKQNLSLEHIQQVLATPQIALAGALWVVALAYVFIFGKREKRSALTGWFALLVYLPVEALFLLIAIILLLFGALLSGFKRRERDENVGGYWIFIGDMLGFPLLQVRKAFPVRHRIRQVITAIHNQTAFYTMQSKGVRAGDEGATFVRKLAERLKKEGKWTEQTEEASGTRIHLLGHSFGALLVANLAEKLMETETKPHLRSVCLVQGALSSVWFTKESKTVKHCQAGKGIIGCIYSRYDTATGAIFPLANYRRKAAGYVGLGVFDGEKNRVVDIGKADVDTIRFMLPEERILLVQPPTIIAPESNLMNIDASHLIYEGAVASGGGHDDIFKDDVVALIWGIATTEPRKPKIVSETKNDPDLLKVEVK